MTELTPTSVVPASTLSARHRDDYRNLAKTKRHAKNTLKTSNTAQVVWVNWCKANGYAPTEITVERVVAFIADEARKAKKPNTIRTYVAMLSAESVRVNNVNLRKHPDIQTALTNVGLILSEKVDQAAPITLPMLAKMIEATYSMKDQVRGARNRAMASVAYYSAMRGSNLVALNLSNFKVGTATVGGKGVGIVTLYLAGSKTDQERRGAEVVLPETGTPTCPVKLMREWIRVHPLRHEEDAPLFVSYRNGVAIRSNMSLFGWTKMLREMVILAGLDETNISSHSMRAGRATDLVAAGVPDTHGMAVTGHKSEQVYHGYDRTKKADAQIAAAMKVENYYRGA